jgi:hypothetical protein
MIAEGRRFLEENRRWLIVAAMVLAANLVLRFAVVTPLRVSVEAREAELEEGQAALASAVTEWDRSSRRTALLERAERNIEALYTQELQTHRRRFAQVDSEIKRLANEFGLSPTAIQYHSEEVKKGKGLVRHVTSFPLKGGYLNLRNFIKEIEASPQFFMINRVSLTDPGEKGTELNLQISVTTYFWRSRDEDGAGANGTGES